MSSEVLEGPTSYKGLLGNKDKKSWFLWTLYFWIIGADGGTLLASLLSFPCSAVKSNIKKENMTMELFAFCWSKSEQMFAVKALCDPHAFISSPVKTEGRSKMYKHEVSRLTVTEECGHEPFQYKTCHAVGSAWKGTGSFQPSHAFTFSVFMSVTWNRMEGKKEIMISDPV